MAANQSCIPDWSPVDSDNADVNSPAVCLAIQWYIRNNEFIVFYLTCVYLYGTDNSL